MSQDPHPLPVPEMPTPVKKPGWLARSFRPFRTATLRGLAIILPPLLTIVFFLWAWNVIDNYVLRPVESGLTSAISYSIKEVYKNPKQAPPKVALSKLPSGQWIPSHVVESAEHAASTGPLKNADDYYRAYVKAEHLRRHLVIPAFLALFMALLYLLGKLLAAGVGRFFLHFFENLITRLPIIRNVYSSVKQVTDFALNENDMTFTRIVAVQYPRQGVWSMGFVTGEGMNDVSVAAGEPILSVLMPTSPMPATGFTIMVPKSETVDLNITIDQAVQFCVSCGVVVPINQLVRNTLDGKGHAQSRQLTSGNKGPSATTQSPDTKTTP